MNREMNNDTKLNVMFWLQASLIVVFLLISFVWITTRSDKSSADVYLMTSAELNELQEQVEKVTTEIVTLRESVNHSKEKAAMLADKTQKIVDALNREISELKHELRISNGKKK